MTDRCDQCQSPIPKLEAPAIHLEGWQKGREPRRLSVWVCSPECKKAAQVRAALMVPPIVELDDWTAGHEWTVRMNKALSAMGL